MRTTEKDKVADAIDHVLHELQAARRDLRMTGFCLQQAEALRRIYRNTASLADLVPRRDRRMTGFCLQQAEALRRIDRTKASLADLVQSLDRKNKHSAIM